MSQVSETGAGHEESEETVTINKRTVASNFTILVISDSDITKTAKFL